MATRPGRGAAEIIREKFAEGGTLFNDQIMEEANCSVAALYTTKRTMENNGAQFERVEGEKGRIGWKMTSPPQQAPIVQRAKGRRSNSEERQRELTRAAEIRDHLLSGKPLEMNEAQQMWPGLPSAALRHIITRLENQGHLFDRSRLAKGAVQYVLRTPGTPSENPVEVSVQDTPDQGTAQLSKKEQIRAAFRAGMTMTAKEGAERFDCHPTAIRSIVSEMQDLGYRFSRQVGEGRGSPTSFTVRSEPKDRLHPVPALSTLPRALPKNDNQLELELEFLRSEVERLTPAVPVAPAFGAQLRVVGLYEAPDGIKVVLRNGTESYLCHLDGIVGVEQEA